MLTQSSGNGCPQKNGEPKKTKSSNHPFRQFSPQVLNYHGGRDCFLSLFVPPASLRGSIFTDILNGFYIVNLDRYYCIIMYNISQPDLPYISLYNKLIPPFSAP